MKKVSAIVLAVLMLVMAAVPFAASADDAVLTLTAADVEVAAGEQGTLTVKFANGDDYGIINGSLTLIFKADEVEIESLIAKDKGGNTKFADLLGAPISKMTADGNFLTAEDVSDEDGIELAEGEVALKVAFASSAAIEDVEGDLLVVPVKLQDGVKEATIKVSAGSDMTLYSWSASTNDAATAEPIEVKVAEKAAATTAAPTTAAPTTAAPTTDAPATTDAVDGGENTPWALLTVTALAGAALVGLTMKRK